LGNSLSEKIDHRCLFTLAVPYVRLVGCATRFDLQNQSARLCVVFGLWVRMMCLDLGAQQIRVDAIDAD
jgi:hypothetical protein